MNAHAEISVLHERMHNKYLAPAEHSFSANTEHPLQQSGQELGKRVGYWQLSSMGRNPPMLDGRDFAACSDCSGGGRCCP